MTNPQTNVSKKGSPTELGRHTPYAVEHFRIGKSLCGECGGHLLLLHPVDPELAVDMPSFFLCAVCDYVGQVGVAPLWPKKGK